MSGYAGSDDEQIHAMILNENGIAACQELLVGSVLEHCLECGTRIPEARREFLRSKQMKCHYCIDCQTQFDKPTRIKMLDNVL